ncbi:hypothetical protein HLRTI_000632 [Halorhabdus tiamatea SARL4B]|uniref:Galactose-1-phosphate uridylyltransferase n=1 Tax=Halorhabdus tiamatea SARL4B TaxID=1033806 RepID=F7PG04_9EURY|nr:hypothetical protein [Halorhabdus tiamatea]ERJ07274.1 hypothetical protein HLRTI_000632 [Halorhabdus tiamatea SARL4B]CCQ34183.1 conserved hypothetical protein containing HIT-like domain [Halorhabdus tiamatea SARL4B]
MTFDFDPATQTTWFHSPLEDFEEVSVETEVREDPLTGRQSRIVSENFVRPEGDPDIAAVVGDREGCFFCPDMVTDATPTYPDWVGFDRGEWGEATSFPNLNPYGDHSNVVVLTEDHYVPIDEFTVEQFTDGLAAALEFVDVAFESDAADEYASINMNFLRPAGSSIIHPHMQTLIDECGTNRQADRAEAARAYREEHDASYWDDAISETTESDRYIGSTGAVEWVAPYAPKHHRHVRGVAPGVDVPDPTDPVVEDLAAGIVNVLDYYGSAGHNSFNLALTLQDGDPANPPVIDLVSRAVFEQYYWSDSPFFATLHDESVVDVPPEDYATEAAAFF